MFPVILGALGRFGATAATGSAASTGALGATGAAAGAIAGSGAVGAASAGARARSLMGSLSYNANGTGGFAVPGSQAAPLPIPPAAPGMIQKINTQLNGLSKSIDAVAKPLALVDKGFDKLTGVITKAGTVTADFVTKPLQLFTKGLDALNAPALKVASVLGEFRDSVTAVGNALAPFVQLANPAIVQRFKFASDDLTASIGKALIPAMEFATKVTRSFADIAFALSGPFKRLGDAVFKPLGSIVSGLMSVLTPMIRTFGQLVDLFAAVVRPINEITAALVNLTSGALGILFEGIGAVFEPVIGLFTAMARILGDAAVAFNKYVQQGIVQVRNWLGIKPSIEGGSTGAAVRGAGLSSVEAYQNKAITAAFGLGTASTDERTAGAAEGIYQWLVSTGQSVEKFLNTLPDRVAAAIAGALPTVPSVAGAADVVAAQVPGGPAALAASRRLEDRAEGAWREAQDWWRRQ